MMTIVISTLQYIQNEYVTVVMDDFFTIKHNFFIFSSSNFQTKCEVCHEYQSDTVKILAISYITCLWKVNETK